MIIPGCTCSHATHDDNFPGHHPHCPAVAEPQPLNAAQIASEADYITRCILLRKDQHGNLLFPNLAAHVDP